ncbi:hypothetical protein [Orientia tsutsugamushi]
MNYFNQFRKRSNIEEKEKQTNLYIQLEAGELARISCIDLIQYIT